MRILLAEDERALSKALVKIFEKNNYSVDAVYDGEDAVVYLRADCYDVAILDIMMPKLDGISVLKKIRSEGNQIPVLMLTAKSEIEDRVLGIRSITRPKSESDSKITVGNVTLDRKTFELTSPTGSFRLANKEYQMMEFFMLHPHSILSAEMFMDKIWGFENESELNVVWVYISYLRKKLTALNATVQIKSSRNLGYSLEDSDD